MTTATLQMKLTVSYDLNGTIEEDLKTQLRKAAAFMAGTGLLSGESPATLDWWTAVVQPLGEETPPKSWHPFEPIYFSCCPVRASEVNPDGSPALIDECPLAEAQWIGVYRHNPDHEGTDKMPSDWIFDIPVEAHAPDYALKIGHALVDLLNNITPVEAVNNPNLHIFFE